MEPEEPGTQGVEAESKQILLWGAHPWERPQAPLWENGRIFWKPYLGTEGSENRVGLCHF